MALACNHSYLGGKDRKDLGSRKGKACPEKKLGILLWEATGLEA
jgi:hypothetical protein